MSSRPIVLVIAGSDSSGGAGLLRDVQVLTEFGTSAKCAITAVTVQTHSNVAAIHHLSPALVRQQMSAALDAGGIGAIKIGMLGTADIVETVAAMLPPRDRIPIVLDPVLAASSGALLLEPAGILALRTLLIPRVTLLTPNVVEAAALLGIEAAKCETAMIEQALRLLQFGSQAVLIKGGHAAGTESVDVLVRSTGESAIFRASRIDANLRGTGCALSSAIAASLAAHVPMEEACSRAKQFVLERLQEAAALQE